MHVSIGCQRGMLFPVSVFDSFRSHKESCWHWMYFGSFWNPDLHSGHGMSMVMEYFSHSLSFMCALYRLKSKVGKKLLNTKESRYLYRIPFLHPHHHLRHLQHHLLELSPTFCFLPFNSTFLKQIITYHFNISYTSSTVSLIALTSDPFHTNNSDAFSLQALSSCNSPCVRSSICPRCRRWPRSSWQQRRHHSRQQT